MIMQVPDKQPVDQKEFLDFLQGLRLQTLRVRHLKVDAEREFAHSDIKKVRHREAYAYELSENGQLRIDTRFEVQLVGPRRKKLGSITVVFGWYYHSEQEVTEEIFKVFAPMVRFQSWPHLREIIQSTAARANWPRLTIPLMVAPKPG
jgi:hypothetical protein